MAVLIEGISVVVRVDAIVNKFPGSWERFKAIVPNQSLCADNEVVRIGFMSPADVETFVTQLQSNGLEFLRSGKAIDIAVADQQHGLTTACSWLEFGHVDMGSNGSIVAACRLMGSKVNQVVTPPGWKYESSISRSCGFAHNESVEKDLKYLRHENGLDVYLNIATGEEVYVGRTAEQGDTGGACMHDDHCGCEKHLRDAIEFLQDENWEKAKICYGKALECHEDNPIAWANLGVCYDSLNDEDTALKCYNKALVYNPKHKHALVNKGGVLARKGLLVEAMGCFRRALQVDPQFETAHINLQKAINELEGKKGTQSTQLKIVHNGEVYRLKAGDEFLRTPKGTVIETRTPDLLEAIISDLSGQDEIVVEDGILEHPRCISAYVLASTAIDFPDIDGFLGSLPGWLESDIVFSPTSGHLVVLQYQEDQQSEVRALFHENDIPLRLLDEYDDEEWEEVVAVFMNIVSGFSIHQVSALVNLAWPNGKQFITTIAYLLGRYNEAGWAEAIFSRTRDVCRIIGDEPLGEIGSVSDGLSDEERQETIEAIIQAIENEAHIVKRYLEIASRIGR